MSATDQEIPASGGDFVSYRKVDIRLSADEIMDYVDEMLSWLAIASEGDMSYEQSHFYRAKPLIYLGGFDAALGVLTPSSVVAEEEIFEELSADQRAAEEAALYRILNFPDAPDVVEHKQRCEAKRKAEHAKACAALARRIEHEPRYARCATLIERCDEKTVLGLSQFRSVSGDKAEDAMSSSSVLMNDGGQTVQSNMDIVSGVRYSLSSVGEHTPKRAAEMIAWQNSHVRGKLARAGMRKWPGTARVFCVQNVCVLRDGRSLNAQTWFGYWNERLHSIAGAPVFGNEWVAAESIGEALDESQRRRDEWGIEIALGARRTGIELQTDAVGAREFGNMLRRSETAAGRRKSLVHWVNEHMRRRSRGDADATVLVQGHLRGQNRFDAGRYHARIYPPQGLVDSVRSGARYASATAGDA